MHNTLEAQVLADTSFFIRLSNQHDPLHEMALLHLRHFVEKGYHIRLSTIALAEYCVRGQAQQLPMQHLRLLPFNAYHAYQAGEFHRCIIEQKYLRGAKFAQRAIVPNDTKLFAQAQCEAVRYYITSDEESRKIYEMLRENLPINFEFLYLGDYPPDYEQDLPFEE